jgi:hypothetical protein
MGIAGRILEHLHSLPEPMQARVLDFIEYLERAADGVEAEDADWSVFSLSEAMRGLEDEPSPYSVDDLKETFS